MENRIKYNEETKTFDITTNSSTIINGNGKAVLSGDFVIDAKSVAVFVTETEKKQFLIKQGYLHSSASAVLLNSTNEALSLILSEKDNIYDALNRLERNVDVFNSMPWYKRLFKKVKM